MLMIMMGLSAGGLPTEGGGGGGDYTPHLRNIHVMFSIIMNGDRT